MKQWLRLFFIALILLAMTAVAHAHTELLTTAPPPGSTISTLPEIRLTFSEPITEESTITLFTNTFQPVAGIMGDVDASSPTELVTAVPPLAPDDYTVQWTAVSMDGHISSGTYTFRLASSVLPVTLLGQIGLSLLFLSAIVILWRRSRPMQKKQI